MQEPLARLNEPDYPTETIWEIADKITPAFVDEMRDRFGLIGSHGEISGELGKVLWRFQAAAKNALEPLPAPQAKELDRLKKSVDRSIAAFDALNDQARTDIDNAVMYRDPFNQRFYFEQQQDYWDKNENSTKTAMNKLAQISHALDAVMDLRKVQADDPKRTINTPLDHLIQDLTMDFEKRTDRKAYQCCYYDPRTDNYSGQYYDFIEFILDHFAPRSYHSQVALGKRIVRALGKMVR
ncbi:hypothetical protein [Octadecabacter sp. R77987]|uniref:hypothetical protein n=1 Tax=Octadecabacter sp. R77987 TaxID=3093874 RepID=UPI00366C9BB7